MCVCGVWLNRSARGTHAAGHGIWWMQTRMRPSAKRRRECGEWVRVEVLSYLVSCPTAAAVRRCPAHSARRDWRCLTRTRIGTRQFEGEGESRWARRGASRRGAVAQGSAFDGCGGIVSAPDVPSERRLPTLPPTAAVNGNADTALLHTTVKIRRTWARPAAILARSAAAFEWPPERRRCDPESDVTPKSRSALRHDSRPMAAVRRVPRSPTNITSARVLERSLKERL